MKIKLLSAILLLITIVTFSCSNPDDKDEVVEEIIEEEEEEEIIGDGTKIIDGIKYGENFILFETETTKSDLGLWIKRVPGDPKYYVGNTIEAINKGYLEFTGNNLNGGNAKSPLEYEFTCPKSGKYRMVMRMYQPLLQGEAGDKRNDVWVKLAGDFTTACIYPTEDLKTNHKFWGRGVRKWGSTHNLEGHINGVKKLNKVVYNLKKDAVYTFTISGRAQGCSLDYVLLYDESLGLQIATHDDIAATFPVLYRPSIIE